MNNCPREIVTLRSSVAETRTQQKSIACLGFNVLFSTKVHGWLTVCGWMAG